MKSGVSRYTFPDKRLEITARSLFNFALVRLSQCASCMHRENLATRLPTLTDDTESLDLFSGVMETLN